MNNDSDSDADSVEAVSFSKRSQLSVHSYISYCLHIDNNNNKKHNNNNKKNNNINSLVPGSKK